MKPASYFLLLSLCLPCTAQGQVPDPPSLAIETQQNQVSLNWTEVAGAEGYRLLYADFPAASTLEIIDMGSAISAAAELPFGSAFYVGIQAYNAQGTSLFSNIDYFSLIEDPNAAQTQTCRTDLQDPRYAWPIPGVNGRDWVISNYVDLTPGVGISDYASMPGNGKSYDGHNGIDISLPTFREQDIGVDVKAIHSGLVTDVEDSFPDRATACLNNDWNVVTVRQNDGNTVYYGHLKTGSATVAEGQFIAKGEVLGQVGSSGCSTASHLHLELRGGNNQVVDPFLTGQWCAAPPYEIPVSVFTGILLEGPASLYAEPAKDPPPDIKAIELGARLLPILHSANGLIGDSVGVRMERPDGSTQIEIEQVFTNAERHGMWVFNTGTVDQAGVWTVHYLANGISQYILQVRVL